VNFAIFQTWREGGTGVRPFVDVTLLFFLGLNSEGSSSPSIGGFPFPTRFKISAILAGLARRARSAKYFSVRNAEIFSATATLCTMRVCEPTSMSMTAYSLKRAN
jgi:hypothetical protein